MADMHNTAKPDDPREMPSEPSAGNSPTDPPNQAELIKLDQGAGASVLQQRVSELEDSLETLTSQRQETDHLLRQLHTQTEKLQGNFDTHLDLTNRKLQAVLEKYMGLKDQARELGEHSARMQSELSSTRSQAEDLVQSLDEATRQRIQEASEGVQQLLQDEAERSQQRHRELTENLQASQGRLTQVELRAAALQEELDSRAKVLQGTIEAVEQRLHQELQRIEQEARERDEALRKETAELREADQRQEQRAHKHEDRFGELEAWVRSGEIRTDTLEERAGELNDRTASVEQRASALEQRATRGEDRSDRLEQRNDALEGRTSTLEEQTIHLTRLTGELDEQTQALTGRSDALEVVTEAQGSQLARLAERLRRQLRGFSGALLLLLLAIGLVVFYLYNTHREVNTLSQQQARTSTALGESLREQQLAYAKSLAAHTDRIQDTLTRERTELVQADQRLHKEVATAQQGLQEQRQAVKDLEQRLLALQDQAESAVGRLSVAHPLGNYGSDNTIHGRTWLNGLDSSQRLIRLAQVNDKRALYAIADRWSFYLRDRHLAYLPQQRDGNTRYSLFYGPFDTEESALRAARMIPAINPNVPLRVLPAGELQQ